MLSGALRSTRTKRQNTPHVWDIRGHTHAHTLPSSPKLAKAADVEKSMREGTRMRDKTGGAFEKAFVLRSVTTYITDNTHVRQHRPVQRGLTVLACDGTGAFKVEIVVTKGTGKKKWWKKKESKWAKKKLRRRGCSPLPKTCPPPCRWMRSGGHHPTRTTHRATPKAWTTNKENTVEYRFRQTTSRAFFFPSVSASNQCTAYAVRAHHLWAPTRFRRNRACPPPCSRYKRERDQSTKFAPLKETMGNLLTFTK